MSRATLKDLPSILNEYDEEINYTYKAVYEQEPELMNVLLEQYSAAGGVYPAAQVENYYIVKGDLVCLYGDAEKSKREISNLPDKFAEYDFYDLVFVGDTYYLFTKAKEDIEGPLGEPPTFWDRYQDEVYKDAQEFSQAIGSPSEIAETIKTSTKILFMSAIGIGAAWVLMPRMVKSIRG